MPAFVDPTGHRIYLDHFPARIVSLVPSQTELLYDLGLDESVIGITKFCVHPDKWFHTKTRVGGTKQLHLEIIHQLQPDLVIANREENVKEQIQELQQHYPVWTSDVHDIPSALQMISSIGEMVDKEARAKEWVDRIETEFKNLIPLPAIPAAYLIWQNPFMTVGSDTFIHAMMEKAGLINIFQERQRYPEISIEDLKVNNCKLLLLSSEPFPFQQKHIDELMPQLPGIQIKLVDGELFSWYGSRMVRYPSYMQTLKIDKSEK